MDFSFLVPLFIYFFFFYCFFRYFSPHTLGPACSLLRFIYILSFFPFFREFALLVRTRNGRNWHAGPFSRNLGEKKKLLEKYIKEIYCQLQRGYKTVSLSSIFIFPVFFYRYILFSSFFPLLELLGSRGNIFQVDEVTFYFWPQAGVRDNEADWIKTDRVQKK